MKQPHVAKVLLVLFLAAFFIMPAIFPEPAQSQAAGARGSPTYDPSTETTVSGVVEAVQSISRSSGWHGIHLQLRTPDKLYDVHMGPSWFLDQKGFHFVKGDRIEVLGSHLLLGNRDTLIAREIKKGKSKLVLRNAKGIPAWSRGYQL